jgi:alkanesulfonate monooxygenase SsuD/methylene tetrahydromethanopterin reductase-like flavin-dependent oxidoreductase (luciferase family)
LPPPIEGYYEQVGPQERAIVDHVLARAAIGSPATVTAKIDEFVERTQADELMLTAHLHDPAKRLRSFEIVAEAYLSGADRQMEAANG